MILISSFAVTEKSYPGLIFERKKKAVAEKKTCFYAAMLENHFSKVLRFWFVDENLKV